MQKINKFSLFLVIPALAMPVFTIAETEILESAVEAKLEDQKDILESQKKINVLAEKTGDMVQQYRDAIRKKDSLNTYNEQLKKLIGQQKLSLESIQRQLDNVENTQRSIVPLMLKMIETLDSFVSLDIPFLLSERHQRVQSLKIMMDRPDVTLPDKYRRIMEAYQIEMEYGRTIETYNETIDVEGQKYTVDILRIGRLLMAFQTLDGNLSGLWNKNTNKWEKLASSYNRSINKGLLVAKKQAPPELIKLPIQIMEKQP